MRMHPDRIAWSNTVRGSRVAVAVVLLLLLGAAGCNRGPAAAAPPPPTVTVNRPLQREVVEWDEYTGHIEAPEYVEVRARVSGQIVDAPFKEGAVVQMGKTLFVLDKRPFKADFDSKQADVMRAQAQLDLANVQLQRTIEQLKSNAVSKSDYDNAVATVKQAQAALDGTQAALESSRLNLEWCDVVAPITGRVSKKIVTPGNLINGGSGQTTLLTTIESIDPMYCYVDVDERSILKYVQLDREKKRVSARNQPIPTYLQLENETTFSHRGVVDFVDNKVDPSTGTLEARGVFPNPGGYLTPGFFARIRVAGSGRYLALLIPDYAVGTDQNVKFVLIAGPNDVVERRTIKLGALFGELRAVAEGITADDQVLVDGLVTTVPGSKVNPVEKPVPAELFRPMVPSGDEGLAATQPATAPATQRMLEPAAPPAPALATQPAPEGARP
jgi:multidrug efflux system membrane fusion protein